MEIHKLYTAYWDGLNWNAVGTDSSMYTRAMSIYNGHLYIGFTFPKYNMANDTLTGVAMWDGSDWKKPGKGVNGGVGALFVYNNELIVGGGFSIAGDSIAEKVAAYSDTTTGVKFNEVSKQIIKLMPNPTNNIINIVSTINIDSYSVININGQKVLDQKLKSCNNFSIDIKSFPKAVYNIVFYFGNEFVSKQIIKK